MKTLTDHAHKFISEFSSEHDVELHGFETREREFCNDNSRSNAKFTRTTFHVTGFKWFHPHGATISGEFAKPIEALVIEEEDEGAIERTYNDGAVADAIVAKCGRISGFADSCLA